MIVKLYNQTSEVYITKSKKSQLYKKSNYPKVNWIQTKFPTLANMSVIKCSITLI